MCKEVEDIIKEITNETLEEKADAKRTRKARVQEQESLKDIIKAAAHLNKEKTKLYLQLANFFTTDFRNNIFKDQFELQEKYPETSVDEWTVFLNDRVVRVYINRHKDTLLRKSAETNLADPYAKNKRDSMRLIESIDEKMNEYSSKNIVIMRMPGRS